MRTETQLLKQTPHPTIYRLPPARSRLLTAAPVISLLIMAAVALAACGGSASGLSNVTASTSRIVPGSRGLGNPPSVLELRYTLGSPAHVTAHLQGPQNATLLDEQQDAGDHIIRFTGVITGSKTVDGYEITRSLVPVGDYTLTLGAGGPQQTVPIRVDPPATGGTTAPPSIENLVMKPDAISPNSDAVDDVSEITFRTNETATLRVDLAAQDGSSTVAFAPQLKGPGEQSLVVNGQDLAGNPLPDGTYTVTVQAEDPLGNRSVARRSLKIENSGQPSIEILKVEVSPVQITLGSTIAVTITVRNNGKVPLRTQGPDPGYTYDTNNSYSSIEGGKWVDRAGLWRVGVDWDGNTGGGPYRYPFRWALKPGGASLMPGETAVTGGRITVLKQEKRMWFYAGVLQEGIRIVLDRLGRTAVDVSY